MEAVTDVIISSRQSAGACYEGQLNGFQAAQYARFEIDYEDQLMII